MPCKVRRAVIRHTRCVQAMDRLLQHKEVDLRALKEVVSVQKQVSIYVAVPFQSAINHAHCGKLLMKLEGNCKSEENEC